MKCAWVDGKLQPSDSAVIGALGQGVQTGLGVFEAMKVVRGEAFAMNRHLRRLAGSAAMLSLVVPYDDATLRDAVREVLATDDAATKVRITVIAGVGDQVSVTVSTTTASPWPPTADLIVSPFIRNERSPSMGAKTTSYVDNVLSSRAAKLAGADEAILCDSRGYLSEGTASNLFLVVDGELCTPSLANGGLGGMTREVLLELVECNVSETLTVDDLRRATEVFITSSTRDVHPVASIDGVPVELVPGPITVHAAQVFADVQLRTLDP